jgi:hypothetical protein
MPLRVLLPRQRWSRKAFAGSAALHALGFVVLGWVTRGDDRLPNPTVLHSSRAYALHYFVLSGARLSSRPRPQPDTRAQPKAEPLPVIRLALASPVKFQLTPPATISSTVNSSEPASSPVQVSELSPGAVAGVGQVSAAPSLPEGGLDQVAELKEGAGSACPEFRPPQALAHRGLAVTIAFVVDAYGVVDRTTLRVIESPGRPQTEHKFQSHIYVVGARVRPDRGHIDPAAYDSVVSDEVASHVADLAFRPALREGRTVRSTVLISCQTSQAD